MTVALVMVLIPALAALLGLLRRLQVAGGDRLLDVQWATPHLVSLGAVELTRREYHRRLDAALPLREAFEQPPVSTRETG